MTVEEIFSQLAAHMIKGLMIHSQMSDYFGFLGLKGYQECHKYHYFEENANYRAINKYYLYHYNKLIPETRIDNPNIIPDSWYRYTRQDVNSTTRKNAIENGFNEWINWEKDTKKLYEQMYNELLSIGEVCAAYQIGKCIDDVDNELAYAEQKVLELKSIDYDIGIIIEEQKQVEKECKKKLKEIEL